ncbi:MAG: NnrS family protein [Phycisphaerae bacterium]|nr:NnrS family protein [Phycisphaerae bacterium]
MSEPTIGQRNPATRPTDAPKPRAGTYFAGRPTISIGNKRRAGAVFLRDAFRPFYLGGSIFAALAVPLWLVMWRGGAESLGLNPALAPMFWHAHEMVFGFAAAIIVGFLFTAARNWTGLSLPANLPLAVLVVLWLGARVGMLFTYGRAVAVVDTLLLPIIAGVLAFKFVRARSFGNLPLVLVLAALATANGAFHAGALGLIEVSPLAAVEFGLMMVVLIEMIVGGRIVPGFTASAIPGVRLRRSAWLNRAAVLGTAATFSCDALRAPANVTGAIALLSAALVGAQCLGWNPLATRSRPILWVLHASYAFIPAGLLLLGLAWLGVVPRTAAIHALAVGSTGGLIIGMITRTALGHTGRPVRAGRWEAVAYVLVLLAAVIRVAAALVPSIAVPGVLAAGAAWSAGFLVYAASYGPLLIGLDLGARRERPVSEALSGGSDMSTR